MVNKIGTVYPGGLNNGFSSRFSRVQHEIPEEGRQIYRLKRCEYNNEFMVNRLNILSNNKDFTLNNQQWLIYHKTKPNQTNGLLV